MVGVHRSRSDEQIPKLQILYPNPAAEEYIGIPRGQIQFLQIFSLTFFCEGKRYGREYRKYINGLTYENPSQHMYKENTRLKNTSL